MKLRDLKLSHRRLISQFAFFLLQNPLLLNFSKGKIHTGSSKMICTPGLNCYSCPAAVLSCPLGSLQLFLAGAQHRLSLFVTGFLLTTGVAFGRLICGYLCPFGLLQDLLYRLKTPKFPTTLRHLKYLKYVVLILFVILLPLVATHELTGLGNPWFCKYICPSGTVFAALPLLAATEGLRRFLGLQFVLKLSLALGILLLATPIYRFFCRVLCPLGAIYALLNPLAIYRLRCARESCTSCGACARACRLGLHPQVKANTPECLHCGDCLSACPQKALVYGLRD